MDYARFATKELRINATVCCDGQTWSTVDVFRNALETIGTLKKNLMNHILFQLPQCESNDQFFNKRLTWNPPDDEVWNLDSDSSSLDYLCQLADCLGLLKETEVEFSISDVNFSCCFQQIPLLSLSTKILSIGMRSHPQQLIKNMEDFISTHAQMQFDTQKLCHFASKQTGSRGIEPPGNCLTGILIGNTSEYPTEVASKLGEFCDWKKRSVQPPRMISSDVTKKIAFSLSGIRRLGRFDSTNGDRWCYMEAALCFGHDSRSTNTLLTENGCPWNLSKIARSPIWEMGDLYSTDGLEWDVEFQVPISALPRHTRLCITFCYIPRVLKASPKCLTHKLFFDCDENSASFSLVDWNALYEGEEELRLDSLVDSYVIIPLFDSDGSFYFCKKNLTFSPAPTNDLDFNLLFSPIGSFYQPMATDPEQEQTDSVVVDRFKCISFDKRQKRAGKHLKYGRAPEIKFIANSPSWSFSANLQKRNYLKCFEELEQLDWSNKLFVDQLESDLESFKAYSNQGTDLRKPKPPLWIGLKLLTYKFSSQSVRSFAVGCLENVDDEMLRPLMSPLVQALKFDDSLNSDLAQFLFSRSLRDISMGYQLCWLLLVECENVTYKGFYLVLLQSFLKNCKPRICRQFLKALLTDKEMSKWATSVQLAYHKYSPQAAHYSLMRSISAFEDVSAPYESAKSCFYLGRVKKVPNGIHDSDDNGLVPNGGFKFRVPLCNLYNPRIKVKSIDKTKCKIMNSKKLPLWLSFELQEGTDTELRERHTLLMDDEANLIYPNIRINGSNTFTGDETTENLGRDIRIMSMTKADPELFVSDQDVHDQEMAGDDTLLDIRGSLTLMIPEHAAISLPDDKSNRNSLLSVGSFSELDSPGPFGERKLTAFSLTVFDNDTRITTNFLEIFNLLTSRNLEIYEVRWASSKAAISEKERGISLQSSVTSENSFEGQNSKRSVKKTYSTRSRSPSISSTPTASAHNSYIGETTSDDKQLSDEEELRHELESGVKLTPTTFLEDSMVVVADVNERYLCQHQLSPPLMGMLEGNKDEAVNETELSASEFCEIDPEQLYMEGGLKSEEANRKKTECEMIYKAGDDLRQDALVMQLFELMLNIWRDKPVMKHIALRRYGCLASSQNTGAIEVVQDAVTLCKTQHIYNARLNRRKDYWDKESLKRWLEENNPPSRMAAVKERFFWSALGSCVATFVLGIGDRHSDNMMIERDGTFLHIDFGHILGNFKKFKMIARETTPFFFTPDFVEVLDGANSATYTKFKTYFVQAYMHLRENAHLFIAIFELMLGAGMPELRFPEHISYLKDKTLLLNDNSSSDDNSESTAGERNKDIHSKIMDIFDSAAANQRQILNQRIHQLK